MTDEGKILNIAGDYIAHGIRHRASEITTLTLGRQSELAVQQKLSHEVDQDRFTRLDRTLLTQINDEGLIDSQPLVNQSALHQADRYLLLRRLKRLEQMGFAREEEPGLWSVSDPDGAHAARARPVRGRHRVAALAADDRTMGVSLLGRVIGASFGFDLPRAFDEFPCPFDLLAGSADTLFRQTQQGI